MQVTNATPEQSARILELLEQERFLTRGAKRATTFSEKHALLSFAAQKRRAWEALHAQSRQTAGTSA